VAKSLFGQNNSVSPFDGWERCSLGLILLVFILELSSFILGLRNRLLFPSCRLSLLIFLFSIRLSKEVVSMLRSYLVKVLFLQLALGVITFNSSLLIYHKVPFLLWRVYLYIILPQPLCIFFSSSCLFFQASSFFKRSYIFLIQVISLIYSCYSSYLSHCS